MHIIYCYIYFIETIKINLIKVILKLINITLFFLITIYVLAFIWKLECRVGGIDEWMQV